MEATNQRINSNSEIRRTARERLKGNWGIAVLLCIVCSIIAGLPNAIPYIGYVLAVLLQGPMILGLAGCFMKLIRGEEFLFEDLFNGFKNFSSAILLQILMGLFIVLWTFLLVIPGIIAALSYSMAPYILNDNPEIGAMGAIKASKKMMKGYKGKLFGLQLSFIGWGILGIFTIGIGYLWLIPYVNASIAAFYQNLKEAQNMDAPKSNDRMPEPSLYKEIGPEA